MEVFELANRLTKAIKAIESTDENTIATIRHLRMLAVLAAEGEPMYIVDINKKIQSSKSSQSRCLNVLKDRGLVKMKSVLRSHSIESGRKPVNVYSLTKKGLRLVNQFL